MTTKAYEYSSRTVDQAIEEALAELQTTRDQVEIEVLDEGGSGILGFGRKPAKILIKVVVDDDQEEDVDVDREEDCGCEAYPFAGSDKLGMDAFDDREEPAKQAEPKTVSDEDQTANRQAKMEAAGYTEDLLKDREQAAVKFVAGIMNSLGIHGRMSSYYDEDFTLCLEVDGEDVGNAIGRRGETLEAIQYLTGLAINRDRTSYVRLSLDVAGYQSRKEREIQRDAKRRAKYVARSGRTVHLNPMSPADRRKVHMALRDFKGVDTFSEGDEPRRHVVIAPDKQ